MRSFLEDRSVPSTAVVFSCVFHRGCFPAFFRRAFLVRFFAGALSCVLSQGFFPCGP